MTEKNLATFMAAVLTVITGVTLLNADTLTPTHALQMFFNGLAAVGAVKIK